jgi:hypothetical protein
MAAVYLGQEPESGRRVAVKVLPRQFTFDPEFRGRFQREARVLKSLDHPAIVPVYDFGEDDEQPYMVMAFMPGGSLAERIQAGPLPPEAINLVLERIGSALDYAHGRGIIHRDLKPANILYDEQDNPYLCDFGIIKLTEETASYTGSSVIGTPAYMSPEQVHGSKTLDGRSDLYSFGLILFEMLTGHRAFRGSTAAEIMMRQVVDPVPRLAEARPGLPALYQPVVNKALAKEREDRYNTAAAFAADFAGVVATAPPMPPITLTPPPLTIPGATAPHTTPQPTAAGTMDAPRPARFAPMRLALALAPLLLFACLGLSFLSYLAAAGRGGDETVLPESTESPEATIEGTASAAPAGTTPVTPGAAQTIQAEVGTVETTAEATAANGTALPSPTRRATDESTEASPTSTRPPATATAQPTATTAPTATAAQAQEPGDPTAVPPSATPVILPTNTATTEFMPPPVILQTNTPTAAPPTSTSIPPTNTAVPPTSTAAPPTDTPIPPTDTPPPPTPTP